MANSWRIDTNFFDRSQRVLSTTTQGIGATVINAPFGSEQFTFFNTGESQRIIETFGSPSQSYPELFEALQFNNTSPLYIASAVSSTGSSYGGAILYRDGSTLSLASFPNGSASPVNSDFALSDIPVAPFEYDLSLTSLNEIGYNGTINNALTQPSTVFFGGNDPTIQLKSRASGASADVVLSAEETLDNAAITFDLSSHATNVFASLVLSAPDANGRRNLVVTPDTDSSSIDPSTLERLYFEVDASSTGHVLNTANVVAAIGLKAREPQRFSLELDPDDNDDSVVLTISYEESGRTIALNNFSKQEISFKRGAEDGFGREIFIETVIPSTDTLFGAKTFIEITNDDFGTTTLSSELGGGSRTAGEASDYNTVYNTASSIAQDIDVFFDASRSADIATNFITLRSGNHRTSLFLSALPVLSPLGSDGSVTNTLIDSTITSIASARSEGLIYYLSEFLMRNSYNNMGNITSSAIGEIAAIHSRIRRDRSGGVAPSWINEGGIGGQLTSGAVLSSRYSLTDAQTETLDNAGINPAVVYRNFGAMILSRRTSKAGAVSDYSFVDNLSVRDIVIRRVTNDVLLYQVDKPNDETHRLRVINGIESIVKPLTITPNNFLFDYRIVCDATNNTAEVLDREEMVVDLFVQFTRKSRIIRFNFSTFNNNVSLEEL